MSNAIPTTEGTMSWNVPGAGKAQTWYKIYGDLKLGIRPLVVLHGGPGLTHDYLDTCSEFTRKQSIPVVFYDQIGGGRSTHFPDKMGDTTLWTDELFLNELKHLLNHLGIYKDYDLLGNSWGGMLAARHASTQAGGLKHLVVMSSTASLDLWIQAQFSLRKTLPQDVQATLDKCEREGRTDSKEYTDAVNVHYSHFLCTVTPVPEGLQKSFEALQKDPTVYFTMYGPSIFALTGTLRTWSFNEGRNISAQTLLINGAMDEATDACVYPYFKQIPCARWIQFGKSSHMAHLEEPDRFFDIVGKFLNE